MPNPIDVITQDGLEDPYKGKLEEIVNQINELKDNNDINDKIEGMSGILTAEFAKHLNPETAKKLLEAIPSYENQMPDGLKDLIDFLEPIANKLSQSNINGDLDLQTSGTFKSKIDQKKVGQEKSDIENFKDKWGEDGKILIDKIENIDDERLTKVKSIIEKIRNIISKPNETNTKMLQKFIYENLDENDKTQFAKKNCIDEVYNNDNFDGKFGISTLTYLGKVLPKIEKYIDDVKESIAVEGRNKPAETVDNLNNVTVKNEIDLADGDVKAEELLDHVPSGVEISFKEGSSIDKNKTDPQEVTVVIKKGSETKKISLIVKIEGNKLTIREKTVSAEQSVPTPDNSPLQLGDKNYPVAPANQNLPRLNGGTFYLTTALASAQGESSASQGEQTELGPEHNEKTGERIFYLKFTNGDLFKVSVDDQGNLCPVATKVDSMIGNDNGEKILLKNNNSCISYLKNKMPKSINNPYEISWHRGENDYVFESFDRILTIEPMAIAGDWISKDLSRNLAFLNLTNYIRNLGDKYENPDPDIKFDDSKLIIKGLKRGKHKNIEIELSNFGLSGDKPEELKRFKKYNNHEDWEDDWDRKKDNRNYGKVEIPNVIVSAAEQPAAAQGEQPTATQQQSAAAQGEQPTATQQQSAAAQREQPTATQQQPAAAQGEQPTATQQQPTAAQGEQPTAAQGEQPTAAQGEQPTVTQGEQPTAAQGEQPAAAQGEQPAAAQGEQSAAAQGEQPTQNSDPEHVVQYGLKWVRCPQKNSLGLSGSVYQKNDYPGDTYYCKIGDNKFKRVKASEPYFMYIDECGFAPARGLVPGRRELNVCQAGVDKLNDILKNNNNVGLSSVVLEGGKYVGVKDSGSKKELDMVKIYKIINNESIFLEKGTRTYNDGEYSGWLNDGIREGKGTFRRNDGDTYEGEWKNDRREGKGTFRRNDGATYEGEWKNGKMEGKGTYKGDGIQYEGEWKNNRIIKCMSYGNTITIDYEGDLPYIKTKNGAKLMIQDSNFMSSKFCAIGVLANTINRIVNIVKYARSSSGGSFKLDQFEEDGGKVQADYEYYIRDTDLLSAAAVKNSTGVDAKTLVNWLNQYRHDVGI